MDLETVASELRARLHLTLPPACIAASSSCSSYSSSSQSTSEPQSPDSGFSSDDSSNSSPLDGRTKSGKILRSAIRRLPSGCRKTVRFADSVGEELEKREYFSENDHKVNSRPTSPSSVKLSLSMPNFAYCSESEYLNRTRSSNVCVSGLSAIGGTLIGQINVLNVAFYKKVVVRWTVNDWKDVVETEAAYSHSADGAFDIDVFTFSLVAPPGTENGQWDCCVCYYVAGTEFWDNNNGKNYIIKWQPHLKRPEGEAPVPRPWSRRALRPAPRFF